MERTIKAQHSAVCLLQDRPNHGMTEIVARGSGQLPVDNYFHPVGYRRRELSMPKQQILLILCTNQVTSQLQIRHNVYTLLHKLVL